MESLELVFSFGRSNLVPRLLLQGREQNPGKEIRAGAKIMLPPLGPPCCEFPTLS